MNHTITRAIGAGLAASFLFAASAEAPPFGTLFLEAGLRPFRVVDGDFNGDGVVDLATMHAYREDPGSVSFSVFFGRGDGAFETRRSIAGATPLFMVAGDFDGNGVDELLSAAPGESLDSAIYGVYGVDGKGQFVLRRTQKLAVGPDPDPDITTGLRAITGDFNGDDRDDVALLREDERGLNLFLGFPGGFDQALVILPKGVASSLSAVCAHDLNDDGEDDLVLAYGEQVFAWSYDGGAQTELVSFMLDEEVHGIVVGEFDGAEGADLFAWNGEIVTDFKVLTNFIDTPPPPFVEFDSEGLAGASAVAIDADEDGLDDIVSVEGANSFSPTGGGGAQGTPIGLSAIMLNRGGELYPPLTSQMPRLGFAPGNVVAADFNGDGTLDLATVNATQLRGTVTVLIGQGGGSFGGVAAAPNSSLFELPFAGFNDVNFDGYPDIVSTNGGHLNEQGRFDFALRPNDAVVRVDAQAPVSRGEIIGRLIAELDINRDSLTDRVVEDLASNGVGVESVLRTELQQPGGGFVTDQVFDEPAERGVRTSFRARRGRVADLNGDGIEDVLVDYQMFGSTGGRALVYHAGSPDGQLKQGSGLVASAQVSQFSGLGVADVDLDGDVDILLGDEVSVQGVPIDTSSLINGVLYNRTNGVKVSCDADFNGDGRVGPADLSQVLPRWGATDSVSLTFDLDGDGVIGAFDLAALLAQWGDCE